MKPQTRSVLALMRLNPDGITALDALRDVDSLRLGARIWELKQAGYAILTESVETHTGKRIAKYRLADERPEQMRLGVA